jgi:hypothetical protein
MTVIWGDGVVLQPSWALCCTKPVVYCTKTSSAHRVSELCVGAAVSVQQNGHMHQQCAAEVIPLFVCHTGAALSVLFCCDITC